MRPRVLSVIAVAVSLLLAGCSDDEPGEAKPGMGSTGGTSPIESTGVDPGGDAGGAADAPTVSSPVANVDKFLKSPCDMLTKAQAADLGFDAKITPELEYDIGPRCVFHNENDDSVSVVLVENQPLGISGLYRNHQEYPEQEAYFEPVDVGGFPAVFLAVVDDRADGGCGLSVGVTDKQIVSLVNLVDDTPGVGNPCDELKRAAEAVVTTMSKG